MSTRRARIKAVASLPVRRKNIDSSEDNKTNQSTAAKASPKINKETISTSADITKEQHFNNCTTVNHEISIPSVITTTPNRQKTGNIEKVSVITPNIHIINTNSSSQSVGTCTRLNLDSEISKPNNKTHERFDIESGTNSFISTRETSTLPLILAQEIVSPNIKRVKNVDIIDGISIISHTTTNSLIPEENEDVVDGIVPLNSAPRVPKPLDLLKNEIISENAEVSFDPIVPLPSPSKVRPKLRPTPRLAPFRRNSIQGSASESEDESRRVLLSGGSATPIVPRQRHDSHTSLSTQNSVPFTQNREINRVRNDSVCSIISQTTTQPALPISPLREKHHLTKSKRLENSRRMSALRRRQRARVGATRDTLTMYDLIFYNPTTNPIMSDKEDVTKLKKEQPKETKPYEQPSEDDSEENVDDPLTPAAEESVPVPQIKLGPNGEIILDEKSLVIEQTECSRKLSSSIVHESDWSNGGKGKYSRTPRTADWADAETVRFYRALAAVGTDFSVMAPLFPKRTRRDLKIKFKKEEKINSAQVDKALRSQVHWDALRLESEFAQERRAETEKAEREKQTLLEQRQIEREKIQISRIQGLKTPKGGKVLGIMPNRHKHFNAPMTANEMLEQAKEPKRKRTNAVNKMASTSSAPNDKLTKKPNTANASRTIKTPTQTVQSNVAPMATITPAQRMSMYTESPKKPEMATITKMIANNHPKPIRAVIPQNVHPMSAVTSNIETGSLVVLTVNDPNSIRNKMLQTYITDESGRLTPVSLPQSLLNSVVGYMKKNTPSRSTTSSPQFSSPNNINHESRNSVTPSVIQINPSPTKRVRNDSYTITQL